MVKLDFFQNSVITLNHNQHARIIGAPGTGKTVTLVAAIEHLLGTGKITLPEVLVIAPTRLTATGLRDRLDAFSERSITGGLVMSPQAFAFSVVHKHAASKGETAPKLLTGSAQNKILEKVIAENIEHFEQQFGLNHTLLNSQFFHDELRDIERIFYDYKINKNELAEAAADPTKWVSGELTGTALKELQQAIAIWQESYELLDKATTEQKTLFDDSFSANQFYDEAEKIISDNDFPSSGIPRLILIDDAQDLNGGAKNMLMSLALRGSRIWAFGDPDMSTAAFQGKRSTLLQDLDSASFDRGRARLDSLDGMQEVVLHNFHRFGRDLAKLVHSLTSRIGASGVISHRRAEVLEKHKTLVEFTNVTSTHELIATLAHRLRSAHFGTWQSGSAIKWSKMAVVARSQAEVEQIHNSFGEYDIPTQTGTGGVVLKNNRLSRDLIIVLLHTLSGTDFSVEHLEDILTGPIGRFDRITLRRFKQELLFKERESVKETGQRARKPHEALNHFFREGELLEIADKRAQKVLKVFQAGNLTLARGGSVPEILWSIWNTTGLAESLRLEAMSTTGFNSAKANDDLDSVMNLFYVIQRHEDQVEGTPYQTLLQELLVSDVAQDTLARTGTKEAVLITTPQGVVGKEFDLVCVAGLQDGVWPNLKTRGSILRLSALETLLTEGNFEDQNREETLHDELRLFTAACSKAKKELLVVAVSTEETFPSLFYRLGREFEVTGLPSESLTLRGYVSKLRRNLETDADDSDSALKLAVLAREKIPGAAPEDWYGMKSVSSTNSLFIQESAPNQKITLSPSKIEEIEKCPLNWLINDLGGGTDVIAARLGTLIHLAFEKVLTADLEEMKKIIDSNWHEIDYEAKWQSDKDHNSAIQMLHAINSYLKEHQEHQTVASSEAFFKLEIDEIILQGFTDRIYITEPESDGPPLVIDLKTSSAKPVIKNIPENAQLQAYQAALLHGTFYSKDEDDAKEYGSTAGAGLLIVHPNALRSNENYRVLEQAAMTEEQFEIFKDRVREVVKAIAETSFEANIEHHCESFGTGKKSCSIHIIPPVSKL